ncbi:hypothetical protein BRC83_08050 [Halobacteriales archaeon QS_1_68_17]|nr:MAG: hypothetical protein BRC83_08050 [Halobacteriales archaeon QS_1_68_17]
MNFAEWEPVYEAVLADFGYDRADDGRARDGLASLTGQFDLSRLDARGDRVAVAGAGPSLTDSAALERAGEADAVFAASAAAKRLEASGVAVDLMVTDLDKVPETARALTERGTPVAAHAHGDNVPAIEKWVPQFEGRHVLPTTQAEPAGPVRNFGGFTDGDRAAFLADYLGASELAFVGWDLDDPAVGAEKRRKLRWAERLLLWLERRRGERFALLDGRRERIDDDALRE